MLRPIDCSKGLPSLRTPQRRLARLSSPTRPTPNLVTGFHRHDSTSSLPATHYRSPGSSLFSSPTSKFKPFFVTTPIFYVNASPHIGHLHSLLLTDILARYSRLRNPDRQVIFTTGTDEHGMKIQQAAKAKGLGEEEFCAEDRLTQSGDIYKGTHSGWYSVSDESFHSSPQVKKLDDGRMVAIETGNEVVWEEEDNWKFRLPRYRDRLLEWVSREDSVYPPSMRTYIAAQMDTAEELSISRPKSRVRWGVPVPGDPEQTIYVWVDALVNYLTVLGYPTSTDGWPVDVHVVGKDIVRFHALHWPALLMAAGMEPPSHVLAHAHWTMGRTKMSKSKGNVVDPIEAMQKYGVDLMRWYLMRAGGSLPVDSDYSDEQLKSKYKVLASQIGNLLNRISTEKMWGRLTTFDGSMRDPELDFLLGDLRGKVDRMMGKYDVVRACEAVLKLIAAANKMFTTSEPWKMDDPTGPIIYAWTALRLSGILLQTTMPTKAAELLDRLGVPSDRRRWEDAAWPVEVDAITIGKRLETAGREWSEKGFLFPLSVP